jgi:zinc transport system substrate-binding protein
MSGLTRVKSQEGMILIMFFLSSFALTGCASDPGEDPGEISDTDPDRITVVATIFPLYEFSKAVGGDRAEVTLLLPPGTEPHTFEPKPSDVVKITGSDIFIYNGAGLEPWALDILHGTDKPEGHVMDASSVVLLQKTDHGTDHDSSIEAESDADYDMLQHDSEPAGQGHSEYDPHFWLDFSNDMLIVDAIAVMFSDADPANRDYYMANARDYNKRLSELDDAFRQGLSSCRQREFITGGHDAYGYLARRYGLSYVSAFGISPDSEPTPKTIKEISDIAEEHGIRYILFEETVSPRLAEAIAEESGAETMIFNPGHNLRKDEFKQGVTFISIMEENLNTLVIALDCR